MSRAVAVRWLLGYGLALSLLVTGCSGGQPPAATSPTPSASSTGGPPSLQQIVEQQLSATDRLSSVRAVLVSVDGTSRLEFYREGFAADDHEHVWSVTKSVVATLIGIALDEGLIKDLDVPLRELLPRYRSSMTADTAKITLRQLMTMTAGLVGDPPPSMTSEPDFGEHDVLPYILSKGQRSAAGKQFQYSNMSAHVAAAVLAEALRKHSDPELRTVLAYARIRLFDPLGIKTEPAYTAPIVEADPAFDTAAFAWIRIGKVPIGAFGLRLTAPDLLKLGQLYLDDGVWAGRQLVPKTWVKQVSTPSELTSYYGLFWWIEDRPQHSHFDARGSLGQRVTVVPDRNAVIVTLCDTTPDGTPQDDSDINPLVNALADAL